MLFTRTLMGVAAVLAGHVFAQTSTSTPTPEQLHALQTAQKAYPECALKCMAKLIPDSACTQTDIKCLCTNEALNAQITGCALHSCTIYEGLQTKNVSMTMCGAPVRDKATTPLVLGLVGGGLALLAYLMRMFAPLANSNRRSYGLDDWLATVAFLLAVPPTVFAVTLTNNGLGKDMWTLKLQSIKNVLMYYYLGSVFYIACMTMIKLSIMAFILRVFPSKSFRKVCYGVLAIIIGYGIAFVFATALQCWPVQYAWQQVDISYSGKCNNIHLQGWMSAIFNIVIDIILLVLPLKHLWGLQMKLKKKLMIMVMFSLGLFVTIVSVVRLHSLILFANSANITWDYVEAAYWSLLELHVGIICCCLPSCRALLISLGAGVLKSTKGATGNSSKGNSRLGKITGSNTTGSVSQSSRRHGDGDFVPLVEYPQHSPFEKNPSYGVTVTKAEGGHHYP